MPLRSMHPIVGMLIYYLLMLTVMTLNPMSGVIMLVIAPALFFKPLSRLFRKYLWKSWEESQLECFSSPQHQTALDPKAILVMIVSAIALTTIEYGGKRGAFKQICNAFWPEITKHHYFELMSHAYWASFRCFGFVVIPWIALRFMSKNHLKDYGLSWKGSMRHVWIYVILFLIVLPAIVMVSFTASFQSKYPFYKQANRSLSDFLIWEGFYALQFLSLEIFFRGFMLHGLKHSLGAYSIFVMCIPYCMIHFGKPWAESYAAIVAGIVLGTLSLRTNSIWCGVLIHISVAVSMDVLAILQRLFNR